MAGHTAKWLKAIIIIILIPVILVIVAVALLNTGFAKTYLENKASAATGREIKLNGPVHVGIGWDLNPSVEFNQITISNMQDGTAPQMLGADKIGFKFRLFSLFGDQLDFPLVDLDNANILLEKDKTGNANWQFGKTDPNKKSKPPKIGQLMVQNSKLTYKDPSQGTNLTVNAHSSGDFRQQDNNAAQRQDFITLNGDGSFKNAPFAVDYNGASVLDLQNRTEPYPVKTSITVNHTTISVEGTVLDPTELKGLNITLNVKGANAADLFPVLGMALPPTPPYSLTGKLDYADKVWKFNNFKGKLGDSDLSGNLSWDTSRQRPLMRAKFISNNLNFKDLGGFIGAAPKVKSTAELTPEQKAKLEHEKESPYVIPDAPLDISRLASMDAKVEFTGNHVISPNLPLDDFYMNIDLQDRVLKINPVKFGTANGDINAVVTINAQNEPVQIDSDFEFKKLALSRLFGKVPVGEAKLNQGYIGGTAKLKGTGKSLRQMLSTSNGAIGIGMEGGQLSNLLVELIGLDVAQALGFIISGDEPVPVRCIIGDFDVSHGVMTSKTLVIDTTDSNIQGKGTINLANEKMDITLQAHPKDKSILSLKSPIEISGTLKKPNVGIGAENILVRGGLAAAASVVLTPFVGALAFVDAGLGKDSDCAKLINEMNKDTGSTKSTSLVPKNKNAAAAEATLKHGVEKPAKAAFKQNNNTKKTTPVFPKPASQQTPALPGTTIPGQ